MRSWYTDNGAESSKCPTNCADDETRVRRSAILLSQDGVIHHAPPARFWRAVRRGQIDHKRFALGIEPPPELTPI